MRIAITADPDIPVPPHHYGGIERIIDLLLRGLVEQGHDVTLFAHPASTVPCTLKPYPTLRNNSLLALVRNLWHVTSGIRAGEFDVIHSFGRLGYMIPLLPMSIPKVMSYQRPITPRSVLWGERLARGSLQFVGCSKNLIGAHVNKPNWHVVYNGVPRNNYHLMESVSSDAPLVFLGRVEEIKGPHLAIEVSQRTERCLVIAGNIPDEPRHRRYFDEQVAPHIDGTTIRYVGPVDDLQKDELLGAAAALLMPILWDEPFGIVMAEALACGTPVIGLNRGSIPEVVEDGLTGFVCESVEVMAQAVSQLGSLDRRACRRSMEDRFSEEAVVNGYLRVYERARHAPLSDRKEESLLAA
jgi:glycosyltransferase involved in cell wall biosynthesis